MAVESGLKFNREVYMLSCKDIADERFKKIENRKYFLNLFHIIEKTGDLPVLIDIGNNKTYAFIVIRNNRNNHIIKTKDEIVGFEKKNVTVTIIFQEESALFKTSIGEVIGRKEIMIEKPTIFAKKIRQAFGYHPEGLPFFIVKSEESKGNAYHLTAPVADSRGDMEVS